MTNQKSSLLVTVSVHLAFGLLFVFCANPVIRAAVPLPLAYDADDRPEEPWTVSPETPLTSVSASDGYLTLTKTWTGDPSIDFRVSDLDFASATGVTIDFRVRVEAGNETPLRLDLTDEQLYLVYFMIWPDRIDRHGQNTVTAEDTYDADFTQWQTLKIEFRSRHLRLYMGEGPELIMDSDITGTYDGSTARTVGFGLPAGKHVGEAGGPAQAQVDYLKIATGPSGYTSLKGQIVNQVGDGISDAAAVLSWNNGLTTSLDATDADGYYSITHLPSGEDALLEIEIDGITHREMEVHLSEGENELPPITVVRLYGTVRASGEPFPYLLLRGFSVVEVSGHREMLYIGSPAMTNDQGHYSFGRLDSLPQYLEVGIGVPSRPFDRTTIVGVPEDYLPVDMDMHYVQDINLIYQVVEDHPLAPCRARLLGLIPYAGLVYDVDIYVASWGKYLDYVTSGQYLKALLYVPQLLEDAQFSVGFSTYEETKKAFLECMSDYVVYAVPWDRMKDEIRDIFLDAKEAALAVLTGSPVDIQITDDQGNVMRVVPIGAISRELNRPAIGLVGPDNKQMAVVLNPEGTYAVDIVGNTDAGTAATFDLTMFRTNSSDNIEEYNFTGVPTASGAIATTAVAEMGPYVLSVDSDGDGQFDMEIVPDSLAAEVVPKLPPAKSFKARRTVPVRFSLRKPERVDASMPFVHDENLEIRIYDESNSETILQTSTYGDRATDYRVETDEKQYITNFKTRDQAALYVVEVWNPMLPFLIGKFTFETVE